MEDGDGKIEARDRVGGDYIAHLAEIRARACSHFRFRRCPETAHAWVKKFGM